MGYIYHAPDAFCDGSSVIVGTRISAFFGLPAADTMTATVKVITRFKIISPRISATFCVMAVLVESLSQNNPQLYICSDHKVYVIRLKCDLKC